MEFFPSTLHTFPLRAAVRWLYRVARKHAGGNGVDGFAISMPTLFEKSGAEGTYRRFKFEILRIVSNNNLPGFSLSVREGIEGEPLVHIVCELLS